MHLKMKFIIKIVFYLSLFVVLCGIVKSQHLIPASVLSEGCIDENCLKYLARDSKRVSKCFEPLRSTIAFDDYTGVNLCCAVRKYQSCIFPLIISNCGLESMDKFEEEMRSMNSICDLTTLSWNKCEPKNLTSSEAEALVELRE